MTVKILTLPTSLYGGDTSARCLPSAAQTFAQALYTPPSEHGAPVPQQFPMRFLIRTIGLHTNGPSDIDAAELRGLFQAGLAVGLYQHVRGTPGNQYMWTPTAALGAQDGVTAVANANAVGYPQGAMIGVDMEGTNGGNPFGYCSEKCKAIAAGRYSPVIYLGYAHGLSLPQIAELAATYPLLWKDMGPRALPQGLNFSMVQLENTVRVGGLYIDPDLLSGPIPFAVDDAYASWLPQTNIELQDALNVKPEPDGD